MSEVTISQRGPLKLGIIILAAITLQPDWAFADLACKLSEDDRSIHVGYNPEIHCGALSLYALKPDISLRSSRRGGEPLGTDPLPLGDERTHLFYGFGGDERAYGFLIECYHLEKQVPCSEVVRVTECDGTPGPCILEQFGPLAMKPTTPQTLATPSP